MCVYIHVYTQIFKKLVHVNVDLEIWNLQDRKGSWRLGDELILLSWAQIQYEDYIYMQDTSVFGFFKLFYGLQVIGEANSHYGGQSALFRAKVDLSHI